MIPDRKLRLLALARFLNLSFSELVDELVSKGFQREELQPTYIASDEMTKILKDFVHNKKSVSEAPKVVNKIDLSLIDSSSRPKKTVKNETLASRTALKSELDDNYITRENTHNDIANIQADKLTGPKFLGKIKLPNFEKNKNYIPRKTNPVDIKDDIILFAIGKIGFFDYNKNKFGLIEEIVTETNLSIQKARLFEDGISSSKRLYQGDLVFFKLHNNERYFYKYLATNVIKLDEIKINEFAKLISITNSEYLLELVKNLNPIEIENIPNDIRQIILNRIIKIESQHVWSLIVNFNTNLYIEKYVNEIITSFKENIKLEYLERSFNKYLLNNILNCWTSLDYDTFSSLLSVIKKNNVQNISKSSSLFQFIIKSEIDFNTLYEFSKLFHTQHFREKLLKSVSFQKPNIIYTIAELFNEKNFDDNEIDIIKSKLKTEAPNLKYSMITSLFTKLSDFGVKITFNDYVQLLNGKSLNQFELQTFIISIPNDNFSIDVKNILNKSIDEIKDWKFKEVLNEINTENEIGLYVIERHINRDSDVDTYFLKQFIKSSKLLKTKKYLIAKYALNLVHSDVFDLINLAIDFNVLEVLKISYKELSLGNCGYNIFSEHDLVLLIEKLNKIILPDSVLDVNKEFSSFIHFFTDIKKPELSNSLKIFLNNFSGGAQTLTIKYLFFLFSKRKITIDELFVLFNSFTWTEISALLLVEFSKENNYIDKTLTEKLDIIYKNHFNNIGKFNNENSIRNFQIGSIINSCKGRTYYTGTNWQNKRWYFKNGNVSLESNKFDHKMDCFCEGRPWKTEDVWNSDTNSITGEKINFYWCRTSYCASRNDRADLTKPFYDWTISEISEILDIKVEKLALAHLSGWANRMNQIVEHLFCRECNDILRPLPFIPKTLGFYAVPIFNCINPSCSKFENKIRFTHCLNGKCESHKTSEPLDSRDCESCNPSDPNHTGLLCKYCGQVCPKCSGGYKPILVKNIF